VTVAGERRIEIDVGEPDAADELVGGRAPQPAFIGEIETREVRVGVKGPGLELLAVVDDRLAGRAVTAQEIVEAAEAHGIVRVK